MPNRGPTKVTARPQVSPERRALAIASLIFLAVTLAILVPFWSPVAWAAIFAVIFRPLYLRLGGHGMPRRASLLTVLVVLLCIVVPAITVAAIVGNEAAHLLQSPQFTDPAEFARWYADIQQRLPAWASDYMASKGISNAAQLSEVVGQQVRDNVEFIVKRFFSFGQSILGAGLSIILTLYLLYFFLIDGPGLVRKGMDFLPFTSQSRHFLRERIGVIVRTNVIGTVIVAILQGAVGGLVFWAVGVGSPWLWGALMGFCTLLPAIGTGLVWVPTALVLLASGHTGQAIALVICGIVIISGSDNVFRPIIVGRSSGMPEWLVLLSAFGGVGLFGIQGVVIGPVLTGIAIAVWQLYSREMAEHHPAPAIQEQP